MKVKTKDLVRFLDLINLQGTLEINQCILEGTKKQLQMYAKAPTNTLAIKATLKGDYSDLGEVGIGNLSLLRKAISLATSDEVELTKKENLIVIKDKNSTAKVVLTQPQYILTTLKGEDYENKIKTLKTNPFTLTTEHIQEINKHYSLFRDKIEVEAKDKKVKINYNKDENGSELVLELKDKVEKPFETMVAGFFVEILAQINDNVIVNADNNMPIIVSYDTENYGVEYLVAPIKKKKKE
jgi:hypothetical protein